MRQRRLWTRIEALENQRPETTWQYGEGLASLLRYAQRHGVQEPLDLGELLDTVPDNRQGLAGLLAQVQRER